MSKPLLLADLRLSWIASLPELIRVVANHHNYNTISVGILDDHFATFAL